MFIQATKGVFPDGYVVSYSSTFSMGVFRSEMLIYLLWFHQFHFRCESTVGNNRIYSWKLTPCPDQLREPDSTRMGWTHSGVEWPVQYIKGKPRGSWFGSWDTESRGQSDQFCHLAPLLLLLLLPFFWTWLMTWFEPPFFFLTYVFLSFSPFLPPAS